MAKEIALAGRPQDPRSLALQPPPLPQDWRADPPPVEPPIVTAPSASWSVGQRGSGLPTSSSSHLPDGVTELDEGTDVASTFTFALLAFTTGLLVAATILVAQHGAGSTETPVDDFTPTVDQATAGDVAADRAAKVGVGGGDAAEVSAVSGPAEIDAAAAEEVVLDAKSPDVQGHPAADAPSLPGSQPTHRLLAAPVAPSVEISSISETPDALIVQEPSRNATPDSLSDVLAQPAHSGSSVAVCEDRACSGDRTFGTTLTWARSAEEAAEQAAQEGKLVFLMLVSGNFERDVFT